MNLPDRVNADLRRRELDNDDAEEYFAMNREAMIEEEVYRMEKEFNSDDLQAAIEGCSAVHAIELIQALRQDDAAECMALLRDIRDAWIKAAAEKIVEER